MNRRELVKAVAAHTGAEPGEVDRTVRGLTEVITAVVAKGEPVAISGFAKFVKQERPARMGRNPATGEPIRIKASKKAKITPLKGFKDMVMKPATAPKLARGVWSPGASAAAKSSGATAKTGGAKSAGGSTAPARTAKATAKDAPAKGTARKAAGQATGGAKKAATKSAPARRTAAKKR